MRKQLLQRYLPWTLVVALGCSTDTTDTTNATNATNATDAASARDKGRIFATVSSTGELLVLDDATHELLQTAHVGAGPAIVIATPDEQQVFTANWGDNSASAVDTKTLSVTNIPLADRPYVIAMSPDGSYLYAGINSTNQIAVINTTTHAVERNISMNALPASIIVSRDGRTLYVALLAAGLGLIGPGTLVAVDAATGAISQPALQVGSTPAWITIGKDGSRVYTLNFSSGDITVVDTAAWSVVATIPAGAGSESIIGNVTPDGSRLYVSNHGTSELIGIDTANNQIVQHIPLDGRPVGVQFDADGKYIYTTDFGTGSINEGVGASLAYLTMGVYHGTSNGQVRVFELATGQPVGSTVSTGPGPTSVVRLRASTTTK